MKLLRTTLTLALASATVLSLNLAQAGAQANKPVLEQVKPDKKMLETGKKLYAQCAACHGNEGKGDGPGGAALNPKPRNFHANDGWKNGRDFAGLYKTLEEGIPGGPMSSYAHLSAADRVAIINYMRSFGDYPEPTAKDIEKLEKDYNFSKALADSANKKVPLSVEAAIQKLTQEAKAENQKIEAGLKKIKGSSDKGAVLFRKVSHDPKKALATLMHSKMWKNNINDFAKVVLANAGTNGFKVHMGRLSKEEWQVVYSYLKQVLN